MKPKKGKNSPAPSPISEGNPTIVVQEDEEPAPSMEKLMEENSYLKAKLEEMSRRLAEADEVNQELVQAKAMLSDEIVDLTKVLFEEANGMVANEVKARTQLEQARRKLQHELELTKNRLSDESQQLSELKQKLYKLAEENSNISLQTSALATARSQNDSSLSLNISLDILTRNGSYFDILFPERRFNSKTKCNGPSALVWSEVVSSLEAKTFQAFSKFLEVVGKLDDDAVLGSPFARKIYEDDVVPCLSFDAKPKAFIKKVVLAMLKNTCTIERISASSPLPSPVHAGSLSVAQSPRPETPTEDSETRSINSMMSELTMTFTSLPDMFAIDSAYKVPSTKSTSVSTSRFCCLCGTAINSEISQLLYRFKLTEKDPVMLIEEGCRCKLVAVAEFYTYLRHLRRGIFSNRPIIDLYYELLHYLRNMFYARTNSCSFFIQSDLEIFKSI